jgi:hypothetical protein
VWHYELLKSHTELHFKHETTNITFSPSLPDANSSTSGYDKQQYLRIWDPKSEMALPENPNPSRPLRFNVGSADIYEVFCKAKFEGEQHDWSHLDGYLVAKAGECRSQGYYLLRYVQSEPAVLQDNAAEACFTGPFMSLPHFLTRHPSTPSSSVTVLFSPSPSETIPELSGDHRGYSDMPDKASQIINFEPSSSPTLTSAAWESLLMPIGDLVDQSSQIGYGTAIDLLCRQIYNPVSSLQYSSTPIVLITARPVTTTSARNCLYQIYHVLRIHGHHNIEVELVVGTVSRCSWGPIEYRKQPFMASSMGLDFGAGGSLGGFVRLSNGVDTHSLSPGLYAMTCHHVVNKETAPITDNYLCSVKSPTAVLLKDSSRQLQKDQEDAKGDLEQNKYLAYCDNGSKARHIAITETRLEDIEKAIGEALKVLQNPQESLELGHIYRSSGLTTCSTRQYSNDPSDGKALVSEMDWALVKVKEARIEKFPHNTVRESYCYVCKANIFAHTDL